MPCSRTRSSERTEGAGPLRQSHERGVGCRTDPARSRRCAAAWGRAARRVPRRGVAPGAGQDRRPVHRDGGNQRIAATSPRPVASRHCRDAGLRRPTPRGGPTTGCRPDPRQLDQGKPDRRGSTRGLWSSRPRSLARCSAGGAPGQRHRTSARGIVEHGAGELLLHGRRLRAQGAWSGPRRSRRQPGRPRPLRPRTDRPRHSPRSPQAPHRLAADGRRGAASRPGKASRTRSAPSP